MENGRLGEILRGLMRRHHLERRLRQRAAIQLWPAVVGADIARNCWPLLVRDGVLTVGAVNHAWAQTLQLMSTQIVEAFNQRAGESVLREIKVRVGDRAQRPPPASRAVAAPPAAPPLTPEQRARVRELSAHIEDPQLRAQVGRALAGLMRGRRAREAQRGRVCARCGREFAGRGRCCRGCAAKG
jgi:hypothetical protein